MTAMAHMTSMTKAVAVFVTGLAFAAVVTLVSALWSSHGPAAARAASSGKLPPDAQAADRSDAPMRVTIVVFAPSQGSSARIIHIPQAGERNSQANAGARDGAVAAIGDDDADLTPPPRHRVIPLPRHSEAPAPKHHAKAPAAQRHNNVASVQQHGDAPILQKLKVVPKQQSNAEPAPQLQDNAAPAAAAAPPQAEAPAAPQRRTDVPPPQLGMRTPAAPQALLRAPASEDKLTPVRPPPKYENKIETDKTADYCPSVSAHSRRSATRRRAVSATAATRPQGKTKAPRTSGALIALSRLFRRRSSRQAAALVSRTCALALPLPIGTWRGFFASGISRTRSTCRRPFSRLAFFTVT